MSNDMGQEDTVLGAALRRAIETQPVRATPFERSRLALRLAGRERRSPLVPMLAAAAAVVLGLALGAALLGQRGQEGPPAAEPTGTPTVSPTPAASPTPLEFVLPQRVYFARDQLPPIAVLMETRSVISLRTIGEGGPVGAVNRAKARLEALATATPPPGLQNIVPTLRTKPTVREVRVDGDLVTVDYAVPNGDWGIAGSAATFALLQQLVYTATEEPGIHRVLVTENGGQPTTIDQLVIDEPLTREDVLPYEGVKTEESVKVEDSEVPAEIAAWEPTANEVSPGLGRFVIQLKALTPPEGGFWGPTIDARLERASNANENEPGKWVLRVHLADAVWPIRPGEGFHCCPLKTPEAGPIRKVAAYPLSPQGTNDEGVGFGIELDDARPWRVSLEPGQPRTMRIIVDIGGHPQAVSDSIAVYGPLPGDDVARTFTVTGAARAFEAHVAWRLKDANQREVASGFTTASLGTSPVWGTFSTEVKVPDGVSGNVTLEVFWPSPRDGADLGTVAIPLQVR